MHCDNIWKTLLIKYKIFINCIIEGGAYRIVHLPYRRAVTLKLRQQAPSPRAVSMALRLYFQLNNKGCQDIIIL